jgi:hypothetical protein
MQTPPGLVVSIHDVARCDSSSRRDDDVAAAEVAVSPVITIIMAGTDSENPVLRLAQDNRADARGRAAWTASTGRRRRRMVVL